MPALIPHALSFLKDVSAVLLASSLGAEPFEPRVSNQSAKLREWYEPASDLRCTPLPLATADPCPPRPSQLFGAVIDAVYKVETLVEPVYKVETLVEPIR